MSITEVLAELPALSVAERQMLVRRVLDLDESPLSPADEVEIERRWAAHQMAPDTALSLDEMKSRLRSHFIA